MKDHSEELGKIHLNKARDRYICGITNLLILEHAMEGGEWAPSDPTTHEGNIFTNMYGVPWPLFNDISHEFEIWCTVMAMISIAKIFIPSNYASRPAFVSLELAVL
jgi:hypothetical protein